MDYLRGSEIVDAEIIRKEIAAELLLNTARVTLHDDAFLDMNGKLRDFLQEIRDMRPMPEYTVDSKDCDKFVRIMLGRIAECIDDLPEVPFVAWLNHWPVKGDFHAAMLARDNGKLWYYEPQIVRVELAPASERVRQAVDIWG